MARASTARAGVSPYCRASCASVSHWQTSARPCGPREDNAESSGEDTLSCNVFDISRFMDFWQQSMRRPAVAASMAPLAASASRSPWPLTRNCASFSSHGRMSSSVARLSGQGRVRQKERETRVGRSCSRWGASRTKTVVAEGSSRALSRALAASSRVRLRPASTTTLRPEPCGASRRRLLSSRTRSMLKARTGPGFSSSSLLLMRPS